MITKSFIIRKNHYDWMKGVCEVYDLDPEKLIFLMTEYAKTHCTEFRELFNEERYSDFMANKSETYMGFEVMLTETLNNMIEDAVKGTVYTIGYFLDTCVEFTDLHFHNFERWYDTNYGKDGNKNESTT